MIILIDPIHVIPINDLMIHHESADCPCSPKILEGVVVHNAVDGRELVEETEGTA